MKEFGKEIFDFIKDIVIIILIVVVIRTYFVMPFKINGESMADSYYDREFIIVDRFSYTDFPLIGQHREIQRGDVVIFKPGVSEERKYFIKRVIGLPGETIKISEGRVFIKESDRTEFQELDESAYLNEENNTKTYVSRDSSEYIYQIPTGKYFVMGDNRNHSTDSRNCFSNCKNRENYITPSDITGKVFMDLGYFNIKDFSFTHPTTNKETKPQFFGTISEYSY